LSFRRRLIKSYLKVCLKLNGSFLSSNFEIKLTTGHVSEKSITGHKRTSVSKRVGDEDFG